MPVDPEDLLQKIAAIVAHLPSATIERRGQHAALRVADKTFGWFMNDHHGDGVICITCKVLPGESEALLRSDPKRFYRPSYTTKGWVGRRLDIGRVSWGEVKAMVEGSYRLIAPARLLKGAKPEVEARRT